MVTVGLYYRVRPGKETLFEKTADQVIELLAQNPGHIKSFLYRDVKDLHSYAILSEWRSQKEFATFIRSELFKQVIEFGIAELLEQRPQHKVYGIERDLK